MKKRIPVGEICYNMHASPFHVYSRLHQLVTEGVIEVVEAQSQPAPQAAAATEPEVSAEMLQQAKEQLARGAFVEALTLLQDLLEVPTGKLGSFGLARSSRASLCRTNLPRDADAGEHSEVAGLVGNCHDHGPRTEGRIHSVPNQWKLGRALDSLRLSLSRG